uniref:MAT1-2-1 n=1 Tax=Juglanconis sp. TaxID=2041886 RepID=A0A2P1NR34_9PEZI|nr:MAT1-2-1 [Juglanconis sp.]
MTDLNSYVIEELAQAQADGREPAYKVSSTLATAVHQVNASGLIANSYNDGQEFLDFIDTVGNQLHVFNPAKVAGMNAAEYEGLDPQQKYIFSHVMDEVVGEDTLVVNDRIAVNRYLVGPISIFQQYDAVANVHALSTGNHPLVPDFRLPPGWTWAQIPGNLSFSNEAQSEASTAATDEPKKPAQRIPRPPNPFIIYRAAHHKTVADAHPEASNNEISKKIGRQWQNESEEVRDAYRAKAAEIKAAFIQIHPGYKYKPRKSSDVKRRAKKAASSSQSTDADQEE